MKKMVAAFLAAVMMSASVSYTYAADSQIAVSGKYSVSGVKTFLTNNKGEYDSGTAVYTLSRSGEIYVMGKKDGAYDVSYIELYGSNMGLNSLFTDGDSVALYIPSDESYDMVIKSVETTGDDTDIMYTTNPHSLTLENVGKSVEYEYHSQGNKIISYPYAKNQFRYTASYASKYPEVAKKLDNIKESQEVEKDSAGKTKTRFTYKFSDNSNIPNDAFSYCMITHTSKELTGTGYYGVELCFMTREEFTQTVDMLTYYKAETASFNNDSILNRGYTLTPSGESFAMYAGEIVGENTDVAEEVQNIYTDAETELGFDTDSLSTITDSTTAFNLFQTVVNNMTESEKQSVKAKDQLAYLAEEVSARSATINVSDDIVLTDENIASVADNVVNVRAQLDAMIGTASVGVRKTRSKVRVATTKSDRVSVSKADITESVDVVEAVTPFAALEFEPNSVSELTLENSGTNKVTVNFAQADSTSKVTVKFPNITDDGYKAVVDDEGNVLVSKYNPITNELSAKISGSGAFTVVNNEKSFDDLKTTPVAVQNAIKNLASKGVIKGTSENEFAPESPITRAEIAALIVRILNVDDANADGGFSDVSKQNWYFGAAGSSKREGIIAGYEDNTFRGTLVIPKVQITSVIARTLKNRLNYNSAEDTTLNEYSDNTAIPTWARDDVALASYANMVIKRTDNSFEQSMQMTRGDAALVLEKLYDKVW